VGAVVEPQGLTSRPLDERIERVARLMEPRSVAVVGASPNVTGIRLLDNLQSHKYQGRIYPVNPKYDEIAGLKCYPSVLDIPEQVDAVVIRVGAGSVAGILRECVEAKVGAALILVAGFGEDSRGEGKSRQAEIDEILADSEMIVCGPNSEGLLNLTAGIALTPNRSAAVESIRQSAAWLPDGTEDVDAAVRGGVAILSQSGGLAFSLLSRGVAAGVGFSHIVSVGNEIDLDIIDCAEYLITRPEVRVIGMYVEGFRRPERLITLALAARLAGKALVVGKAGVSTAGSAAALSHTGHLAGESMVNDAVFRRHGLIQVYDQEELLDVCAALDVNPPLTGKNVAVVSWSGGSAVWAADALEAAGFELPELESTTKDAIAPLLPEFASIQNPIDVTGASQVGLASITLKVAESPCIDALVVITTLNSTFSTERDGDDLARLAAEVDKPVLVYAYTDPTPTNRHRYRELGFAVYSSSTRCVRALSALHEFGAAQSRPPVPPIDVLPGVSPHAPRSATTERETSSLLAAAGFPIARQFLATTADEAELAAITIAGPVAMKLQAPSLTHKAAAGGVLLDRTAQDARAGYRSLVEGPGVGLADVEGVLVQQMVKSGVEMIVGIDNTSGFGPMVMLGFGGSGVEQTRDVAIECAPLTAADAATMLRSLRRGALFEGAVRGFPRVDTQALVAFVVKLSEWAVDHASDVLELDINPVVVHGSGVTIVDSLLVVRPNASLATSS
jgi:acyl-CoA synthetase (NDP forming)